MSMLVDGEFLVSFVVVVLLCVTCGSALRTFGGEEISVLGSKDGRAVVRTKVRMAWRRVSGFHVDGGE